jgi:glycine betaine/proline transport system permease protein
MNMLNLPRIPIGDGFELIIDFLRVQLASFFSALRAIIEQFIDGVEFVLAIPPFWLFAIIIAVIAFKRSGRGIAIFSLLGIFFIETMNMWPATVSTLSLIITATLIALVLGLPMGILCAKVNPVSAVMRPILDLMQTMPAFVYLIPSVLFFRIGEVPAVISTIIFAMPPVIRLTELGIRQVPKDLIEAGESFGSLWYQMLFKIQLPLAMPTIMAGINQCIMLSLSMVVIASMIGAGGLGSIVLTGVQSLNVGMAFEGGLAVVIIAIILDRLTQGKSLKNK